MWELDHKEVWVPKNWCFWTVVLERLLRVPCTARRSNQSILKEINLEYSLEGLMLKLKLQHFGHLSQRVYSLGKTPILGNIEGRRSRWQDDRGWWFYDITDLMDVSLSKFQETVKDREAWCAAVCGIAGSDMTELLSNKSQFLRTGFVRRTPSLSTTVKDLPAS